MTRNALSALVLCFLDHLFLFLTFVSCHSGIFSNFAFFHHCRLCIWNFRMLTHWNLFAHKTVMSYRIRSFRNNVFLPILRWVSSLLLVGILQSVATDIGISNILRVAVIVSLNSSSCGSAFFFAASNSCSLISVHTHCQGREVFLFSCKTPSVFLRIKKCFFVQFDSGYNEMTINVISENHFERLHQQRWVFLEKGWRM